MSKTMTDNVYEEAMRDAHDCAEPLQAMRQWAQQLEDELVKTKERVKRLESAIDEGILFCEFHGPSGLTPCSAHLTAKNMRKAKEAA